MTEDDATKQPEASAFATLRQLGRLGIAALPHSVMPGGMKAAIQKQIDLEQAAMRMVALCSSAELVNVAATEAKRRESLMTPTDALNSVADDLAHGRLR